jgi:hypothetical protein
MHGDGFRRDLKRPASCPPSDYDTGDGLEAMPAELAAAVQGGGRMGDPTFKPYGDLGFIPEEHAAFLEAALALGSLHGPASITAVSGAPAAFPALQRPGKPTGKRIRAPRPDPNRHAHGFPSRYTCYKADCTGVVALDPTLVLVHCDLAQCVRCGVTLAYCSVCDGFFDAKRVVCFKKDEGFKYARNGQHSLDHAPRKRVGGRKYIKVVRQRPGMEPEEC